MVQRTPHLDVTRTHPLRNQDPRLRFLPLPLGLSEERTSVSTTSGSRPGPVASALVSTLAFKRRSSPQRGTRTREHVAAAGAHLCAAPAGASVRWAVLRVLWRPSPRFLPLPYWLRVQGSGRLPEKLAGGGRQERVPEAQGDSSSSHLTSLVFAGSGPALATRAGLKTLLPVPTFEGETPPRS